MDVDYTTHKKRKKKLIPLSQQKDTSLIHGMEEKTSRSTEKGSNILANIKQTKRKTLKSRNNEKNHKKNA